MSIFKKKKSIESYRSDSPSKLFIEQSKNGIADLQQFNNKTWGLGSEEKWAVDLETGKITFTFPDKIVTADIQVIGSLQDGSFMWGWEHPSVPEPLSHAAVLAKKWGEQNNQPNYTQHLVNADEEKAWEFTAVAARLASASGTYSGASGDNRIYMTFGTFTMTSREKS